MKFKILMIILVGLILATSPALADTFNGSGGGSWADLTAGVVNEDGSPFWDNRSLDGSNQNVGFQLLNLSLPGLQYWSLGGGADNNVFFTGVGGGQTEALLIEIAGNKGQNALYAYDLANPGQVIQIFTGAEGAGTTKSVAIPFAQYGFKMVGPGGTFYSGSGHGEVSSDGTSNFAFFQSSSYAGAWWVGVEDLRNPIGTEGLGDYNDMIFKISTVPLPASVLLLGSGILGLLGLGWRRRQGNRKIVLK